MDSEQVGTGRREKLEEQRVRLWQAFQSCSEREIARIYAALADCDDRLEKLGVVKRTALDDLADARARRVAAAKALVDSTGTG